MKREKWILKVRNLIASLAMECDMIMLDWGYADSKGCMLARYIGIRYRKIVRYVEEYGIEKEKFF